MRMRAGLIGALLAGATAALAATAAIPPLAPVGKWGLDHQPNRCVLQHAFGSAGEERKLAIVPHPGRPTEILLISPKATQAAEGSGEGTILMQPSGRSFTGALQTVALDDGSS